MIDIDTELNPIELNPMEYALVKAIKTCSDQVLKYKNMCELIQKDYDVNVIKDVVRTNTKMRVENGALKEENNTLVEKCDNLSKKCNELDSYNECLKRQNNLIMSKSTNNTIPDYDYGVSVNVDEDKAKDIKEINRLRCELEEEILDNFSITEERDKLSEKFDRLLKMFTDLEKKKGYNKNSGTVEHPSKYSSPVRCDIKDNTLWYCGKDSEGKMGEKIEIKIGEMNTETMGVLVAKLLNKHYSENEVVISTNREYEL